MTTELGPYLGGVGFPVGRETYPEEDIPPIPEEFIKEMKEEQWESSFEEEFKRLDEKEELLDWAREESARLGFASEPKTYEEALRFRRVYPTLKKKAEIEELGRQASLAEGRARIAMWEEWRRKYKPTRLQRFLKGVGRTWKGTKEVAGPRGKISREFYLPRASKSLYVPGIPRWKPTTEFMPAGEAHRPQLGTLRRAGTPPVSPRISVPFRDVERFEGIGTALGRLRRLEALPSVDQAVFQEIHANGDIDIPSHVRKEVKQLGFSSKEIDTSLKRLRNLGLIAPTGNKVKGEQELMVVGG